MAPTVPPHLSGGGVEDRGKAKAVGQEKEKQSLPQNSHSGWKTKHKQDVDDTSVSRGMCVPSIILCIPSYETELIVATQSNFLFCAKMLTQQRGILTVWPGTTMCQMPEKTIWKPGVVCGSFKPPKGNKTAAANSSKLGQGCSSCLNSITKSRLKKIKQVCESVLQINWFIQPCRSICQMSRPALA